jgi:hypothetical protein
MAKTPEERAATAKAARLFKYYRITPEENNAVEQYQRNSKEFSILLERGNILDTSPALLFTDHNHQTGLYRGRLAYLINKALGTIECSYKERTADVLEALALYLRKPPAVQVVGKRYGLIGRAKQKKHPIYGSSNGPIVPPKKERKGKSKKSVGV